MVEAGLEGNELGLIQDFRPRIVRFLEMPRLPLAAAAIGIVLSLPSILVGLQADDIFHRAGILGTPDDFPVKPPAPYAIFSFLDGDPVRTHKILDGGFFPWWSYQEARLSLFRPLTVLTHVVDFKLWPNWPSLMHLHNILWYAMLVFVAAILYRRFIGAGWVGGLAAILFAIDYTHGMPVGWVANRNAIVASFFGLTAIYFHDRWRRDGWKWGELLGPLALGLGLCAGEAAVSAGGYLLGYALFLEHPAGGTARAKGRGLLALLPCFLTGAIWALYYKLNHHGAYGSGVYIDPAGDPQVYGRALIERAPILLMGQWAFPPADFYALLSVPAGRIYWVVAIGFLCVWLMLLPPLLRRDPVARFFACGMFFSMLPASATFTSSRLLILMSFGGLGLLAKWIGGLRENGEWIPSARIWRVPADLMIYVFIFIHGFLSPLIFPGMALAVLGPGLATERMMKSFPYDETNLGERTVIIPAIPNALLASYIPFIALREGKPYPKRVRVLAGGGYGVELRRLDERTLVVRPVRGYFPRPGVPVKEAGGELVTSGELDPPFNPAYILTMLDQLMRDEKHPLRLGDRVSLTGVEIEIVKETEDRRPLEAVFRFSAPLEDSSMLWLGWHKWNFAPFKLPAVGETVWLEPDWG